MDINDNWNENLMVFHTVQICVNLFKKIAYKLSK